MEIDALTRRFARPDPRRVPADVSPRSEFDLLVAELGERMEEYVHCMRELPHVSRGIQLQLCGFAMEKDAEMEAIHGRIDWLVAGMADDAPAAGWEPATRILVDACGVSPWSAESDERASRVMDACRDRVAGIEDPDARGAAERWLARARNYADAGRPPFVLACLRNALALAEG